MMLLDLRVLRRIIDMGVIFLTVGPSLCEIWDQITLFFHSAFPWKREGGGYFRGAVISRDIYSITPLSLTSSPSHLPVSSATQIP